MAKDDDREVIFVERDEGSGLRWLLVGAAIGAGLALLFAPRSGKEMRGEIRGGVRRLRRLANDAIDEVRSSFGSEEAELRAMADAGGEDEDPDEELADAGTAGAGPPRGEPRRTDRSGLASAREELERRLAAARARRRQPVPDDEEPVA